MGSFNDLTGKKFGRLTVIEHVGFDKWHNALWRCTCECGNECVVGGSSAKRGHVRSCGCLNHEKLGSKARTHGLHKHRLYRIWAGIKSRCGCNTSAGHPRYVGRGIRICEEWENDFPAFFAWSMSNGYKPGLQIDRINNDGDYEPSNCRWVTKKENGRNKENTRTATLNGETKSLAEWAEILNIKFGTLSSRYTKGWRGEQLLSPVKKKGR